MLGDIAALTGGTFVSEDLGRSLEDVELGELGTARKLVVTKDDTTVIEGAGKKKDIQSRANQIRTQYERSTSDYDRENPGAAREAHRRGRDPVRGWGDRMEMKERKDRVDDALPRPAPQGRYVPGGSVSFLRAIDGERGPPQGQG